MANTNLSAFDSDLNALMADVAELGSIAETMTSDALRTLVVQDETLTASIIDRDDQANRLQYRIDQGAIRMLALRQPMATDLRRTIGAIRVANDLERICDLAEGIAKRAMDLQDIDRVELSKGLHTMGRLVRTQLTDALDALLREDAALAIKVWIRDDEVDALYNTILSELLTQMSADSSLVEDCTAMLFAAKNLERMSDRMSDICETVYYIVNALPLIENREVQSYLATR